MTQAILYIHRTVHRERQKRQETGIWFNGKVEFQSLMGLCKKKKKKIRLPFNRQVERWRKRGEGFSEGMKEGVGGAEKPSTYSEQNTNWRKWEENH